MPEPALTAAGPVFTMLKRATGLMIVVTAEVLLLGFASGVLAGVLTDAALVILPIAEGLTVPEMVSTTLLPTGNCGNVAATLLPEMEKPVGHNAPPEVLEQLATMLLKSDGELSLKLALNTSAGPLFLSTTLYVIVPPALMFAGPVFTIERSALGLTVAAVLLALLAGFGSVTPVGGDTLALLTIVPLAPLVTVPLTFRVTLLPAGSVGIEPVTLLPDIEIGELGQTAPPDALAQLAVTPLIELGTESLKFAPLALLGPALLIVIE
jgi:hypothetical protein